MHKLFVLDGNINKDLKFCLSFLFVFGAFLSLSSFLFFEYLTVRSFVFLFFEYLTVRSVIE